MNTHEVNVRLAAWSVGAGLPLLPAVLPTTYATYATYATHTTQTAPATTRRTLRAAVARWSVTRRART